MNWKLILKNIVLVIVLAVAVWVGLNSMYFWKNVKYTVAPNEVRISPPPVEALITPNELMIPSLGVIAPIQFVEEESEDAFQMALQNGVVHYPHTANAGEYGNVYIFGHSSDYPFTKGNFKTVFALLPQIANNADIIVSDNNGKMFTYQVTKTIVVKPNETQYLSQHDNKEKLLTLQTSYPVGTALKRFLVIAKLKEL